MTEISLRVATADDVQMIFRWRNMPEIVAAGASNRAVPWEEHEQWFGQLLKGHGSALNIVMLDDQSVGQVRFDRQDETTLAVSIYLLPGFTGRGFGITALTQACRQAFEDPAIQQIEAQIRPENSRSVFAFRKAGFERSIASPGSDGLERFVLARSSPGAQGRVDPGQRSEWAGDDRQSNDYFTSLVQKYGIDAKALGWGSRESQRLRFAVLARVGDLRGSSVLDVGCGQGDLLDWLREQGIDLDYQGVDIAPAMIDVARSRFPNGHFTVRNVLENPPPPDSVDYVMASGVFNLRQSDPAAYMQAMARQLFTACRKGMAFNSLSAWSPVRDPGEFYADPMQVLAWCRELTPRLELLHDYHPRDFSVFLYR